MAASCLKNIGWKFPKYIQVVEEDAYYGTLKAEYKISGVMLTSCYEEYRTTRGDLRTYTDDCNISLLKLLDELAPGVFLFNGLLFDLKISAKSLEIKTPSEYALDDWKYGRIYEQ